MRPALALRLRRRLPLLLSAVLVGCAEEPQAALPPADGGGAEVHFTVRGRWPRQRITYRAEPDGGPVDAGVFRAAVARACRQWSAAGVVELVPAAAGNDAADVTLCWRRGHHGSCEPFGTGTTIAHAGPVGPGSYVHFDAARRWVADAADDGDGYSLYGTALHELGHVLGLGHSGAADAVMATGVVASRPLSRSDLCALRSVYGGGQHAPGDLVVRADDDREVAALRGVAPVGRCTFAVFDADGDGRDDVLVWRTDRAGHGALMVYHFDAGPSLARTTGPYYGVASAAGESGVLRTAAGERLFVTRFANGRVAARRFDEHALLHALPEYAGDDALQRTPVRLPGDGASAAAGGDLDGDGQSERVAPFWP